MIRKKSRKTLILAICFMLCSMYSVSFAYAEEVTVPQEPVGTEEPVVEQIEPEGTEEPEEPNDTVIEPEGQESELPVMMSSGDAVTLTGSPSVGVTEVRYIKGSRPNGSVSVNITLSLNDFNSGGQVCIDNTAMSADVYELDGSENSSEYSLTILASYLDSDNISTGTHTIMIDYPNATDTAVATLRIYDWGQPVDIINDNVYYVDDNGVTSAAMLNDGTVWIKEESGGQSGLLFGLNNENNIFEEGERFHVQWLSGKDSGTAATWAENYQKLDDTHKSNVEENHMIMFDVGVSDPSGGSEIAEFRESVKLYVQIPGGWDADDVKAAYVSDGTDESIRVTTEKLEVPGEGTATFATLTLTHFSPYVIYDGKGAGDSSPDTGDTDRPDFWMMMLLLSGGMALLLMTKKETDC